MISVIMPVYNGAKYIRFAIESVLSQSYDDFEFLITDDGSTDDTYKIASGYDDKRIRLFKNSTNLGIFKTLNAMASKAQGGLIRLLSCDDVIKPNCLETELLFHRGNPVIAMSYCAREVINDSGNIIEYANPDNTPDIITPKLAAQMMFYFGCIAGSISTVTLKKTCFAKTGFFREDMIQSADFEMWARISSKCDIGFIRHPLVHLRVHEGQFSRLSGMGLVFLKEDKIVFQDLMRRLPAGIRTRVRKYHRCHRQVKYITYILHCLTRGDLMTARQVYAFLREEENFYGLLWLWFITAGGRWFKKKPRFVY